MLIDDAKVRHFSPLSKFSASNWGDFQHESAEFERTVIHAPRCRNFRPSKITFRLRRTVAVSTPADITKLFNCSFVQCSAFTGRNPNEQFEQFVRPN